MNNGKWHYRRGKWNSEKERKIYIYDETRLNENIEIDVRCTLAIAELMQKMQMRKLNKVVRHESDKDVLLLFALRAAMEQVEKRLSVDCGPRRHTK